MEEPGTTSSRSTLVRIAVAVLAGAALLAGILYLGAGYAVYLQVTATNPECLPQSERNRPESFFVHAYDEVLEDDLSAWAFDDYQAVRFPSLDPEVTLGAYEVIRDPDAPWVVIVHGVRSCKLNSEVLLPAGMLAHAGFNSLLIDLREHGDSDAPEGRVSGGQKEYRDVLGAWAWLQEHHGVDPDRIGVMGHSMGAGTVAMAFAEEPRMKTAWLDSSYTSLGEVIKTELSFAGFPPWLLHSTVWMARLVGGIDLTDRPPIEAARRVRDRSLMIVHNRQDERIPIWHGERMCEVAKASVSAEGHVDCWFIDVSREVKGAPGDGRAGHVVAHFADPETYRSRLLGFFTSALGGDDPLPEDPAPDPGLVPGVN
jgi:dipeptidyl aminopeptidase/acylaminoacyl peptidase